MLLEGSSALAGTVGFCAVFLEDWVASTLAGVLGAVDSTFFAGALAVAGAAGFTGALAVGLGAVLAAVGGVLDFTACSGAGDLVFPVFSITAGFLVFSASALDLLADLSADGLVEGME